MKLTLTHVVSKIDDCNSATEVSNSVDLLQATRWIAQAWENVSESTIKKCFIKAGFLSENESLVSFPEEHQEFDPFKELEDSELVQVNSLLRDASCASGTDVPSAGEALKPDSTLQTCAKMTADWEEEFFSSLSASSSQNSPDDDSDEDIIEVNAASKEAKVKSLKEAMVILEDVTEYLTSESLSETFSNESTVMPVSITILQNLRDFTLRL